MGQLVSSIAELELLGDEELVNRSRGGDDRALETLIARYRHVARKRGRSFFLAGSDRDDVVQEGMIGLFKAIRDWDGGREVPFPPFAELCISRQIMSAIKSANRRKHGPLNSSVSLDASVGREPGVEQSLRDQLVAPAGSDPVELLVSEEAIAALRNSLREKLTDFEREVLRFYLEGNSYDYIARVLGNRVKAVDNALQRIKRKLHRHLAEQTID
jgi:RNA polymerase sporulation-specific sigma factor